MKNIISAIFALLLFSTSLSAGTFSEISFHGGLIEPQGSYRHYSDNGGNGRVRVIGHLNNMNSLSGWIDFSGSIFSYENEDVVLTDGIFLYDFERHTSEYAFSLHTGLQLGSDSRNSFFRPKAGLGVGCYLFNTETSLFAVGYTDEEPEAKENKTDFRFGWKGYVGVDFFFTPKWGLSFEFMNDQVLNLHHTLEFVPGEELKKVGQTARYYTYSIGVIIPLPID